MQEELQRRQLTQLPIQQQPLIPVAAPPQYDRNDPAIQQAMVEAFSQQSRMKLEWSRKCLEDSGWDFDVSFSKSFYPLCNRFF